MFPCFDKVALFLKAMGINALITIFTGINFDSDDWTY